MGPRRGLSWCNECKNVYGFISIARRLGAFLAGKCRSLSDNPYHIKPWKNVLSALLHGIQMNRLEYDILPKQSHKHSNRDIDTQTHIATT